MQDWIFKNKSRNYWSWREKIYKIQFDQIDWELIENVLSRKSHNLHTYLLNIIRDGVE